jgi:hypothetical protein
MPEAVLLQRIQARYESGLSVSEGGADVYRQQVPEWQPVKDDEADRVVRVNTDGGMGEVLSGALLAASRAVLSLPAPRTAPTTRRER